MPTKQFLNMSENVVYTRAGLVPDTQLLHKRLIFAVNNLSIKVVLFFDEVKNKVFLSYIILRIRLKRDLLTHQMKIMHLSAPAGFQFTSRFIWVDGRGSKNNWKNLISTLSKQQNSLNNNELQIPPLTLLSKN
jgi:hypothetical protein